MKKQQLDLEDLKSKGLNHLAELLGEAEKKDEEDEAEYDDEGEESEDKEDKEDEDEVKESTAFEKAVEGLELQESDVTKMKDVFNAAVEERAAVLVESKLAGIEKTIEEKLQEQQEANDKHIANYLDFVVEGWVKDNQVEIERQVKVDLAESFMHKLKSLFEEHSMIIESDESLDKIAEAQAEVESVKSELAEAVEMIAEARKEVFALRVEKVIAELSEGMTETQKERFSSLVGEVDVDIKESIDSIKDRLENMKEIFINGSAVNESEVKTEEVVIEEEIQESEVKEEIVESKEQPIELDEKMAKYVSAINRSFSARHR